MQSNSPATIYLKDYQPYPFLIKSVELYFHLHDKHVDVDSTLTISRNPEAGSAADLVLDGQDLELQEISVDGIELSADKYQASEKELRLFAVADEFTLKTTVRIYPHKNTSLEGLYLSSGNFCTQCEAQGFRKITFFPDRPDVMTLYTVHIEAEHEKYLVRLSNGNPIEERELSDGRSVSTWIDPHKKPSYLFALVAGNLSRNQDTFTTSSGRVVALNVYTEPHNVAFTDYALGALQRAMRWDEERYGLEYDLDLYNIVAVDDFNMGAMENKGLNVFNTKYVLASQETATDHDFVAVEAVIAHEYFHNWTGNRVTCRDWFQLSLKEGLTVFRDQEFTADMHSAAVKRIEDVRMLRNAQFAEDASPMAHPIRPASFVEINNFYTLTVYEKGAEIVRLYQTLLGREGFRRGMDLYFQRHDGQAVTTEDFLSAMADANDTDLSRLQPWYDQAGTPEIKVAGRWDQQQQRYQLKVRQNTPATSEQDNKKPVVIPMNIGLLAPDGSEMNAISTSKSAFDKDCLIKQEQTFNFSGVTEQPTPSLLREFSAPVKVSFDYSDEQLALLMAHDTDSFNRWDAAQRLANRLLQRRIQDSQEDKTMSEDEVLSTALSQALESDVDMALKAELLKLPSESQLADGMTIVDVDSIHAAREFTKSQLGQTLKDQLQEIYRQLNLGQVYAPNAAGIAQRQLKNAALDYLLASDDEHMKGVALEQFTRADNMTDTIGAMLPLSRYVCQQTDEVFTKFEQRWHENTLVMDKWFSIQAMAPRADTLERVQELMSHSLFSMKNPNKVRSLIGAFTANPTVLHKIDGEGYRFLVDQIIELDRLNPQIAARLAKTLSRWRRFDADRQVKIQTQLQRILAVNTLSKDVDEVVRKSLD